LRRCKKNGSGHSDQQSRDEHGVVDASRESFTEPILSQNTQYNNNKKKKKKQQQQDKNKETNQSGAIATAILQSTRAEIVQAGK
jgi:hypothetical protein